MEKVLQFARDHGFDTVEFRGRWKEYDIYKPDKK